MGTEQAGALAGIRVVDFGQYLAGPLAGMLLARDFVLAQLGRQA